MMLSPMRYKDYIWPHNPRVYEIAFERKMAVNKVPFGRYHLQNLGMTNRVLKGEGEFVGAGAYEEFKKLASLFYSEEPGILVHPVWQTAKAYFVSLSLRQEPKADYVSYAFAFWEVFEEYDQGALVSPAPTAAAADVAESSAGGGANEGQAYYTVVSGDTMWGISNKYGMSLGDLIALNPQIANPNLIYPGNQIRVS